MKIKKRRILGVLGLAIVVVCYLFSNKWFNESEAAFNIKKVAITEFKIKQPGLNVKSARLMNYEYKSSGSHAKYRGQIEISSNDRLYRYEIMALKDNGWRLVYMGENH